VRGSVTRLADFGAFVDLGGGVEGLIHVSEMSWSKKFASPVMRSKSARTVEAVILGLNVQERRNLAGTQASPWRSLD